MDQQITCRDCGATFEFTEGEQAFYAERNLSSPQRCKPCRDAKRAAGGGAAKGGARQLFDAVCSTCGQNCQVPFQPREGRPVLCRTCFTNSRA